MDGKERGSIHVLTRQTTGGTFVHTETAPDNHDPSKLPIYHAKLDTSEGSEARKRGFIFAEVRIMRASARAKIGIGFRHNWRAAGGGRVPVRPPNLAAGSVPIGGCSAQSLQPSEVSEKTSDFEVIVTEASESSEGSDTETVMDAASLGITPGESPKQFNVQRRRSSRSSNDLVSTQMPGWAVCSYGYHSDDGNFYDSDRLNRVRYGHTFSEHDVVGCALDLKRGCIWFSVNGAPCRAAKYFSDVAKLDWQLVVGFQDRDVRVRVNFDVPPPAILHTSSLQSSTSTEIDAFWEFARRTECAFYDHFVLQASERPRQRQSEAAIFYILQSLRAEKTSRQIARKRWNLARKKHIILKKTEAAATPKLYPVVLLLKDLYSFGSHDKLTEQEEEDRRKLFDDVVIVAAIDLWYSQTFPRILCDERARTREFNERTMTAEQRFARQERRTQRRLEGRRKARASDYMYSPERFGQSLEGIFNYLCDHTTSQLSKSQYVTTIKQSVRMLNESRGPEKIRLPAVDRFGIYIWPLLLAFFPFLVSAYIFYTQKSNRTVKNLATRHPALFFGAFVPAICTVAIVGVVFFYAMIFNIFSFWVSYKSFDDGRVSFMEVSMPVILFATLFYFIFHIVQVLRRYAGDGDWFKFARQRKLYFQLHTGTEIQVSKFIRLLRKGLAIDQPRSFSELCAAWTFGCPVWRWQSSTVGFRGCSGCGAASHSWRETENIPSRSISSPRPISSVRSCSSHWSPSNSCWSLSISKSNDSDCRDYVKSQRLLG
eukprot:193595_1